MTVSIERSINQFGESFIVTASLDRHHHLLVREYYCYTDAYNLALDLLCEKPDVEKLALFKRKGK